jgi:hypothetical protein
MPPKAPQRSEGGGPRPQVILDFEYENGLIFISLQNVGSAPAHDVSVKFDKPLLGLGGEKRVGSMKMFTELTYLPAGKKLRTLVDTFQSYRARKQPMRVSTVVTYRGERRARFREKSTHNLAVYQDIVEVA